MIDVGGAELRCEVAGTGHPLVLLHDGLTDSRIWDGRFEALSRLYRTIRYDRRGYGGSSTPHEPFSDVSDLHLLLQHLGIGAARLVGVSNGGKVALEFALEHPRMVEAMVLVGPGLSGYHPSEEKKRRVGATLAVARERGIEAGVEAWMEDRFYPPARGKTAAREEVRRLLAENLPRLLSAPNLRVEPDPPAVQRLQEIVTPTLILVGERDDRDNLAIASILEDELPNATKRVVEGCGHLMNLEAPALFERLVVSWFGGPGRTPASGSTGG